MPEYPYQTWQRLFGVSWPSMAELAELYEKAGITDPVGSAAGNIALQQKAIGGWDPYAAAAASPAAPPAAPAAPPPSAVGPVPVDPGLAAQQWEAAIALQAEIQRAQIALQEQQAADARRLTEAQLAANPADFVAYELYKRSLIDQGFTPDSAAMSDEDIQEMFAAALQLNEGGSAGTGQFGVALPSTQSISRSELLGFSNVDVDILSSFLRGGVDIGGGEAAGIDPSGFFKELEEGLVPVLPGQRTQFIS